MVPRTNTGADADTLSTGSIETSTAADGTGDNGTEVVPTGVISAAS